MSLAATVLLTLLLDHSASGPAPTARSASVLAKSLPAAATVETPGMPVASVSAASASAAYSAIRDQLRSSGVPVLLPVPLPRAIEPARSTTVVSANRTGYTVAFSPETRCFEALSCSIFHVSGFARKALTDRSNRRDRAVRLSDGTRGFFRPQDCSGASCTEASLTFERFGAIYEIDVKAGADDLHVLQSAYRNLRLVH